MNGSKIGLIVLTMAMSCTPASVKMKPLEPVIKDNVTTLYDLYADNPEKFKGKEADALRTIYVEKDSVFALLSVYELQDIIWLTRMYTMAEALNSFLSHKT